MPGPIIPSPFMMPQGRQDQDEDSFLKQLLQSLVATAGQQAVGGLVGNMFPPQYPQQPLSAAQTGEQNASVDFLRQQGQYITPEYAAQNPGLDRQQMIERANSTAPYRAAEIQARMTEQETLRKQQETISSARAILAADPQGEMLVRAFDSTAAMRAAGFDSTTINRILEPTMPVPERDRVAILEATTRIAQAQTEAEGDAFATEALAGMGLVPPGAPPLKGAAGILLSYREQQEGRKIDWQDVMVDFVSQRIGESSTGSGMNIIMPGGAPPSGGGVISVEEAVAQGREMIRRLAPPEEADAILRRWDSNETQEMLTRSQGMDIVRDILLTDPTTPVETLRGRLREGGFTDREIQQIIQGGQYRARTSDIGARR